jgi:hypothetical protein
MENDKPSFERDLWGQTGKLHERLLIKIDYYKSLYNAFEGIHKALNELYKKLNSTKLSMDPTIPVSLYSNSEKTESDEIIWYGVPLILKKVFDYIKVSCDYNNQTLFNIVSNLKYLIKKMKTEKSDYDDFQKSVNSLNSSKNTMEKNMKVYHQKMIAAETSVLDYNKVLVKNLSIVESPDIIQSKTLLETKAKQLMDESIKPFNTYKNSLNKANEIRIDSINKQKNLLYVYQELEEEIGKFNINTLKLFYQNQSIQKGFLDIEYCELKQIVDIDNTFKDIKQLIIDYTGHDKPEEEIPFGYFPTIIDFDKIENSETYQIYFKSVMYIKNIIPEEFPKFNQELEDKKNEMREVTYKLFENYTKEGEKELLKLIEDNRTFYFFLILLSKLRTNNRFQQDNQLIDLLGIILNKIANYAEHKLDYEMAKNCIILSQTFYSEKNGQKNYLLEKIRKHKWLTSIDFWINFIDKMIDKEIDKFVKMREDIKKTDIIYNQDNLNEKLKTKVSELLFSQLLPYVNNMNEFHVPLKNIVQITETFSQKYKLLTEAQKESIFGLISDNKEIEKIRKECEKNNTLLIKINDNKKTPSNTSTFNAGKDKNIITPNVNNDKNKMKNEIMKMLSNNKKNTHNESSGINNNINQKNTKPQSNNNNTSSNNNQRTSSIQLGTSSHIQKSNNKPSTPHTTQKNNNNKPNNTNSNNLNSKNSIQKNDIEKSKKEISEKSQMLKEKNISNKDSTNEPIGSPFGVVLKKIPK